jgi:hypothetical protein
MTPLRWINAGALVLGAVGLLLSWVTIGIVNVTGIDTDDGKFFGVILIITALLGLWYILRTNRVAAVLMLVGWIGLLSIATYEVVNVSTVKVPLFGSVEAGTGLYLVAIAGVVGLMTATIDVSGTWSRGQTRATWLIWTTGLVALLAAIGSGIGGHNHGISYSGSAHSSGNTGSSSGNSGNTGSSGNSGNTGSSGNSGNTGSSGNSGNT